MTPKTIMRSMALTEKPPVGARMPLVSCIIIETGSRTRPATCRSLPKVFMTVGLVVGSAVRGVLGGNWELGIGIGRWVQSTDYQVQSTSTEC